MLRGGRCLTAAAVRLERNPTVGITCRRRQRTARGADGGVAVTASRNGARPAAVDGRPDDGSTVGAFWARVRRYWLLVLAVVWIAALGAVVRDAPDPHAVRRPDLADRLVQRQVAGPGRRARPGYVAYFNDSSYQEQLLDAAAGAR